MANKLKKLLVAGSLVSSIFVALVACNKPQGQSNQSNASTTPAASVVSSVPASSLPGVSSVTPTPSSSAAPSSSEAISSSEAPAPVVLTGITAVNNQTSYAYGNEQLDLTVTANYSDGTSVTITDYQVTGYDATKTGEQSLTVSFEGKTCSVKVKVDNPVLVNISASTNKEAYEYGEDLDIIVKAHYSDGSEVVIDNYTVTGYNAENPGEQDLTVTYEGKTCNLKVLVNDPVLVNITAVSNKESYEYGEDLDIIVVAKYSDGSEVTLDNYEVTGYDAQNPGEQNLTVTYKGKTCNLKVLVNERENKFPLDKLNSFLQLENITTPVISPVGYDAWEEKTEPEQDGSKYFIASTNDEGQAGVDTIADQYAVALQAEGWTVNNDNGSYVAYKAEGDVEVSFKTVNKVFSLRINSFVEFPNQKITASPIKTKATIEDGQTIIFGNVAKGLVINDFADGKLKAESCRSTDTKLDGIEKDVWRFTINKVGTSFTFTDIYGRKLGATGLGQLAFDEGSTEWSMVITSRSTIIANANKDFGKLCINLDNNTLTTYSNVFDGNLVYTQILKLSQEEIIYPTGIALEGKQELAIGKKNSIDVKYIPENANSLSKITWSSSNESIAKVDENGLVTAIAAGNATITAKTFAKRTVLEASFNVEVKEVVLDAWTIMLYICGADLESDNGLASSDITEILKVNNQPEDVNIIIETGGSTSWHNYGIDASKLSRYHVENKSLVLDEKLTKENMGKQSVFESFLTWGLQEYPAEKMGVILWNHGGALDGVCFDSTVGSDNSLTNSETKAAFENVFPAFGVNKLEFIGYDACLMQIQDIAEFNSHYFNYMVGSEEAEAGEGWVYDKWLDDLYEGKDTPTILKANCDAFVAQYGDDQTLSYLNLSKMENYHAKFEAMAEAIKSTAKSNYSAFKTLLKSVKDFGDINYYWYSQNGYDAYGEIDGLDLLNKLGNNATYSAFQDVINEAKTAYTSLVAYSRKGNAAGNANGLGVISGAPVNYPSSETAFTTWRSIFY
ncbi:MAG: bacterial Ig-like domain-containing protein [Bacilli bacterium]|nr:bacterial Ig-like domain-containing protein [Bacilli bacterium]